MASITASHSSRAVVAGTANGVFAYGHDPACNGQEAKMNTRRFSAVPLITAAIMVLAAGCSTAGSNAASTIAADKPEEPDITVAAIPAVDLVGLYIAQDDGLFAQQGLHVAIEKIPSSQAIIADQLKGQVDITAGSYVAYISAQAAGPGSASWPRPPFWDLAPVRWSPQGTRPSRLSPGWRAGRSGSTESTASAPCWSARC